MKNNLEQPQLDQRGFSLIEILVALFLLSIIFISIPSSDTADDRDKLETVIDDMQRAVHFSDNETILRNAVVRMHFTAEDGGKINYSIQAGPTGDFVLPVQPQEYSRMSLKEKEHWDKKIKEMSSQFTDTQEFEDNKRSIPEGVKMIGLGCADWKELKIEGDMDLYFYPNGDRDQCVLYFASYDEIAQLEIPYMGFNFKLEYTRNPVFERADQLEDYIFEQAQARFKEWLQK